jgi:dTDP-glucose pyrophosphorylase
MFPSRINLIPMAGRGSRFFEQKYRVPKPFVPVRGRPMFLTAASSFPNADHAIFLIQAEHLAKYPIAATISRSYPQHSLIPVHGVTEGQACTCLLAEDILHPQASLFIASCDYEMIYDRQRYEALVNNPEIDVIIWTFTIGAVKKANPNAFAYCRTEGNHVLEVVEKRTISDDPYNDPAVVGSFTYRTADLFVQGARQMIAKNIRVNGEFYVGTSINQLIEAGYRVVTFPIDKFISFGNPYELRHFEYWEEYFDDLRDHPYTADYGHKRLPR